MPRTGPEFGRFEQYGLWFAAWVFAFLYLVLNHGLLGALSGLFFFPCGIAPRLQWRPDAMSLLIWVGGWIFYVWLSVMALRTRRGVIYFILISVLVVLLIIDIVGLQVLDRELSRHPFAQ
jgi:hypothetical protein